MPRRITLLVLVAGFVALGALPASAHKGVFTNEPFQPYWDSGDQLFKFKSQTKVVSCNASDCRVPVVGVVVCAQVYKGSWQQIGTCPTGENTNATQKTQYKYVSCSSSGSGVQPPLLDYRTRSYGYMIDHGTRYTTPWTTSAVRTRRCLY